MKIMILGSGAREYSIALALRRVDKNLEFYFAPGNGATESLGTNLNLKDPVVLATYAKEKGFDLCIVGSESFLAEGVVDIFKQQGLAIFGPSKAAAMLETSKSFMKSFLKKYRIKTAKFLNTNDIEKAKNFIYSLTPPIVVKADGLCAGKGVIIAKTHEEAIEETAKMLSGESFGDAGKLVVIEEFLDGYELSIFAVCDGNDFVLLPAAQDHKKLLDNDQGPNTGGMGAYAPSSLANESLLRKVQKDIILPTLAGMKKEGAEFCGVLFIGAMIVGNKPYVLEFNVRF
ncbi:phosphoribosylamine--glycine ligase, partial [Campylobacter jejuni]